MTAENIKNDSEEIKFNEQVESLFNESMKKPEVVEAMNILDKLSPSFKYHSKEHTLDVIRETIRFALADGANRDIIGNQVIAAAWHDVGYTVDPKNHEAEGKKSFEQSETYKTLPDDVKNEIVSNILDTKINMESGSPELLQKRSIYGYLLDADVSNFGRDDFFEVFYKLADELNIDLNNVEAKKNFIKFTIKLMQKHQWKTSSARKMRQATKEKNIMKLVEMYNQLSNPVI